MTPKAKSQSELEIEALADIFNIATSGFEEFQKEAKKCQKGNYSTAACSGNYSTAASSGNFSKAASSGYNSTAASSGNYSTAACSGNYSTAASSGDFSKAASSGNYSTCTAIGYRTAVKGDLGNLLMASEYVNKEGKLIPIGGKADIVDGKKIKADSWYIVESAKWVEVDFTDGIFSRIISFKSGVKKVKNDNGKILFIVSDDNGNYAHGDTIADARESLIYKNVAKFDGKLPKFATGKEWVGIYRALTGACSSGVKMFVDETGKSLEDTYTAKQILKLIEGRFGYDAFAAKVREA